MDLMEFCQMRYKRYFSNSHNRAGEGALLGLTLSDKKGAISFASQEILCVCSLNVPDVPSALIVMCLIVIIIQPRVEAVRSQGSNEHKMYCSDHEINVGPTFINRKKVKSSYIVSISFFVKM